MTKRIILLPIFALFLSYSFAQNYNPKGVAFGAYIGAVAMLEHIKVSDCGYALKANFSVEKEIRAYSAYFSDKQLTDAKRFFYRPESKREVARTEEELYGELIQKGNNHDTACGLLVGIFIGELNHRKQDLDNLVK